MKSKNYLGKPDENRGIIIFAMLFVVSIVLIIILNNIDKKAEPEKVVLKGPLSVVEKTLASVNKLEISDNKLIIEGILSEKINQARIIKLNDVDLVLRKNDEDKYVYNVNYQITTDGVSFSSVKDENSIISLNEVENGDYVILLRLKYETSSNEEGFTYKYYSLENINNLSNIEENNVNISFENYKDTVSYLKLEKNK